MLIIAFLHNIFKQTFIMIAAFGKLKKKNDAKG